MTPEQRQEELSRAYLHAVAAACGFAIGNWSQDQSCIDATIAAAGILGDGHLADPKIDVQLKCTANHSLIHTEHVSIQVSRTQYQRLTARSFAPKILVVLVLPANESEWVDHSADQLVLRKCAHYLLTTGLEPIGTASKVLNIPLAQVFSPQALRGMMGRLSRGESL